MNLRLPSILLFLSTCALAAAAQPPPPLSPDKAAAETASFLKTMIRIDTQDPPGNESKIANYIGTIFKREGIPFEILEPVQGRASIVARLQGTGIHKPILLLAHEDVVPVDRSHWTVDPFAAEIRGDTLFGRGASDDKGPLAAHIETMLQLHRSRHLLSRDIIFLAEASEETSSPAGMQTIVDRYWSKIACEFSLNEGGAAEVTHGNIPYIGISTGEKLPRAVRLTATGRSGHASVPVLDNPIIHLAQAVAHISTWNTPTHLNETTRTFFSRLAAISPADKAALFRSLDSPATQDELHATMPQFYSMMHTTLVPTILKSGFKSNVVPSEAEAVIDIRALPDEDMPELYARMTIFVNDPSITIKPLDTADNMPAAPSSSLHTAMFQALETVQHKLIPSAITIPMMTTGATDSAFLRARGVDAYGVRIPRTSEENEGVHGNDEHINLRYLALYQQFVQQAIEQVSQQNN